MANFFFICWVYLIAITSHLYIKQSKKNTTALSLKWSVPRNPVHVQMAELCRSHIMSQSLTSIQTGYPVFTQ